MIFREKKKKKKKVRKKMTKKGRISLIFHTHPLIRPPIEPPRPGHSSGTPHAHPPREVRAQMRHWHEVLVPEPPREPLQHLLHRLVRVPRAPREEPREVALLDLQNALFFLGWGGVGERVAVAAWQWSGGSGSGGSGCARLRRSEWWWNQPVGWGIGRDTGAEWAWVRKK
jgi:hypothetical protein